MSENLQSDGSPRGGAFTPYFDVYGVYSLFTGVETLIGVFSTEEKAETVKTLLYENQTKTIPHIKYEFYVNQITVF